MNDFDESESPSVVLAAIDRLVAGDLPEGERRELLLRLEADPDGWRRCALAFLEDQTWRTALSGFSAEVSRSTTDSLTTKRTQPRFRTLRQLSVAASIVALTFAAGFAAGGRGRSFEAISLVKPERTKPLESEPKLDTNQVQEVGWIEVEDGNRGELPPRRVPIVSGPGLDEKWLRDQAPSVPDYVRARWEREGYQVNERRNLVSVTLEDGRHVMIPVDEVALDYVGQQPL